MNSREEIRHIYGLDFPNYDQNVRSGEVSGISNIYEDVATKGLRTELRFGPTGNHNQIICFTGVSSVGKDYLLNQATQNLGIKSVSVGTVLAESTGFHRDQIRDMDFDPYIDVKRKAAQLIVDQAPCFVNSHVVTKHRGIYFVDKKFEEIINPTFFVVIIGDSREIILRRIERNEKGRQSDIENEETVTLHQRLTLKRTEELARLYKAGFAVIVNNFDNTKKNIKFIRNLGEKIKP